MALDHSTVRSLRWLFGAVFGLVGAAAGYRYLGGYGIVGVAGAAAVGAFVGWNFVDLFKGRPQK